MENGLNWGTLVSVSNSRNGIASYISSVENLKKIDDKVFFKFYKQKNVI